MEIKHFFNGKKGSFYIETDNIKVAELIYTHIEEGKISIDHTEISDTLKGQGIGYKLIDALVEYLRTNNLNAIPLCSFANAVFKKKSSLYADVLA